MSSNNSSLSVPRLGMIVDAAKIASHVHSLLGVAVLVAGVAIDAYTQWKASNLDVNEASEEQLS